MRIETRTLAAAAFAAPFIVFLAVYVPTAGHGFIADDFAWILQNRIRSAADLSRVALSDNGFYRPAVAFSFAANELAFGLNARAYGLTNVAFAALCGGAIYLLCRAVRLPRAAAVFGSALWLLNLHGVNMAILWISGRTALLATAAAAACTASVLNGHHVLATVLLGVAVLSREDAALLPIVTTLWAYLLNRQGVIPPIRIRRWMFVSGTLVAAYFAVRSTTNAMTPATAPSYYQLTANAGTLLRNAAEYADRTMTFAVGTLLLAALVMRPGVRVLDRTSRAIVMCAVLWLCAFLLPALLLPGRSSLYACLPSAGVCVAAAAVAERCWKLAAPSRQRYALIGAILLPLILWPIYYARTIRRVEMAEFSTRALSVLRPSLQPLPDNSRILIVDDRQGRANVESVFGTLLHDAFLVTANRSMTFYFEPPIPDAPPNSGGPPPCEECVDLRLVVRDGELRVN